MKKIIYLGTAICWMASMACNGGHADSVKEAKDNNVAKLEAQKTGDSTKAFADTLPSKDDAAFLVNAANGGMIEVQLGQLAQSNASDAGVKSFGTMMIKDHGAGGDKIKALAASKNLTIPAVLSADAQKEKDKLQKKTGKDFDKDYMSMMIDDHKKDIEEFEREIKNGTDQSIKSFANDNLPMLQKHLDSAEAVYARIKKH